VRYGHHRNVAGHFLALCADGGEDVVTRFQWWFSPSSDKAAVSARITRDGPTSWWVIPSLTPTKFTLLYARDYQRVLAVHIVHDAMAESEDGVFTVDFQERGTVGVATLVGILEGLLGLSLDRGGATDTVLVRPVYVSPEELVNAVGEAKEDFALFPWTEGGIPADDGQMRFSQFEPSLPDPQAF
jgi:hypothetical protein